MKHSYVGEQVVAQNEYTPIDEIMEVLQELKSQGNTHVELWYGVDDCIMMSNYVHREETDEECANRKASEERQQRQAAERRHELYLELKAEYEPEAK